MPGEAEHPALALVNTRYLRQGRSRDDIVDAVAATRWLDALGLSHRLDEHGAATLRALRENIRVLLTAYLRRELPPAETVAAVNVALLAAPRVSVLHWGAGSAPERRLRQLGDDRLAAGLATVAADAVSLLTGPDAARLAGCGAPGCGRLLLRTHGKRQWCCQRCGDRVRAARHYAKSRDR